MSLAVGFYILFQGYPIICSIQYSLLDWSGMTSNATFIGLQNYKLAINLLDKDEFYDLKKDPDEMVNEIDNPEYLEIILEYHRKLVTHMNATRDLYRGYQWSLRPWNKNFTPSWDNEGFTRQRENEEYEPRQLDYDTGLPIKEAVRSKYLYEMGGEQ